MGVIGAQDKPVQRTLPPVTALNMSCESKKTPKLHTCSNWRRHDELKMENLQNQEAWCREVGSRYLRAEIQILLCTCSLEEGFATACLALPCLALLKQMLHSRQVALSSLYNALSGMGWDTEV